MCSSENENIEAKIVYKSDPEYPRRLMEAGHMPEKFYLLGEFPDDDKPSVAIVGSRQASRYGREVAYQFAGDMAEVGIQIISGMALGVDSYAHQGALDAGGKTFAVLGSGIDVIYPASNAAIYYQMQSQGGVISHFEPGTEPHTWNFPNRNRIISALADLVVVVEAKEQSGSLITADFAMEQGKSVYAVPGRVSDRLSWGCNELIAQGAGVAVSSTALIETLLSEDTDFRNDILTKHKKRKEARMKMPPEQRILTDDGISECAKAVFAVMDPDEINNPDTIAKKLALPVFKAASALTELVMNDYVTEPARNRFLKCP